MVVHSTGMEKKGRELAKAPKAPTFKQRFLLTFIAFTMRISCPARRALANGPVERGLADGALAARVVGVAAGILALPLGAHLGVQAVVVAAALGLGDRVAVLVGVSGKSGVAVADGHVVLGRAHRVGGRALVALGAGVDAGGLVAGLGHGAVVVAGAANLHGHLCERERKWQNA